MNDASSGKSAADKRPRLGIALQGGGSYGAYTKGALTTLFNDKSFRAPSLDIKAVTGTSAGAVNGALLAYGLNSGGPDKACALLDNFWEEIAAIGRSNSLLNVFNPLSARYPNLPSNIIALAHMLPRGFVLGHLKDMLNRNITDWSKLQSGPVKLFVNAIEQTADNKHRHIVFSGKDINADTVAASGALKELGGHDFNGRRFYDGAYWRNPCMSDIKKADITDLLVITLQRKPATIKPEHQDAARRKHPNPGHQLLTEEIHNHLAYIHKHHPHLNLHAISLDVQPHWDETSRMNNDPKWLADLAAMGCNNAADWLNQNASALGKRSSYSLKAARP